MKEEIAQLLSKHVGMKKEEILKLIEIPPSAEMGDYAFPCYVLAKQLMKEPADIALELMKKINQAKPSEISEVKAARGYLNFFVNKKILAEKIINEILKEKEKYGSGKGKEKGKIIIEYETPNTNKPLHVGHLRNGTLGMSISNILEFFRNKVIRQDMFNDRGVHICKAMYALAYLSKKKKPFPKEKSDHFVGDLYVMFNKKAKQNPELEKKAFEMLQKFEQGDKKTVALWKKIDNWAISGIKQTDKIFGNKFDIYFRESDFYKKAKPIIEKGIKKGFIKQEKEGLTAHLMPELPNKVILRKDNTSVYITNDLAMIPYKIGKYKVDKALWVVGSEQNLYFKQLFKIFEKLGYSWVKNSKHISYGIVSLPEGRMKSREGIVVDADDLIEEMQQLAIKELKKRYKLNERQLQERSLKIALAAIKYFFLKVDIVKDMMFNPEEAISFEGDSGPYLQYSYARASSILRKAKKILKANIKINNIEIHEIALIKKLGNFPEIVQDAKKQLNPSLIANYAFQLAQLFNEFYHSCPVINNKEETQRLAIVQAFRYVMKNALHLLGIEAIEEM